MIRIGIYSECFGSDEKLFKDICQYLPIFENIHTFIHQKRKNKILQNISLGL
ncbi:uncharacterized protein ASCRUDRAFT_76773 [Ascoidea rubescens DSM 1968]|uniref:Uncharacterized protein n=1 Tax=Ascoidea rubescens DSM 1968 TaxID=1344418 RepID=A0A1D2VDZ2_9ASCO|nr:hypothetical protein ASCRUDRAFT_76773 [Ascoidea rubescens DSM 1968]ODV59819.1 hypothetical protein ASCRUDRAFT_76773 [Ascoidea rubescens DSM 1968]